jgi:hypothetical protein
VGGGSGNERTSSPVSKLALKAYCSEAHQKAALLADGSISYKQVADLASDRALAKPSECLFLIRRPRKPESLPSWINMEASL